MMLPVADLRLPIYQRLKDSVAARIGAGEWRRSAALPSETQLAAEYQVAVGTVRKAIEGLVAEGVLERHQGRGTYLRRPSFGNALFRFFRHTDGDGAFVQPRARIIDRRLAVAERELAEKLGLDVGAPLLHLFRERMLDGVAILVETIALSADRFAPLVNLPLEQFGDLLYPLYESECGQLVARARETIRFAAASPEIAAALGVAPGAATAVIDRLAFGVDGAPIEWRVSHGPADQFNYTIDLK
jgi:GntR family transcriptional regulator